MSSVTTCRLTTRYVLGGVTTMRCVDVTVVAAQFVVFVVSNYAAVIGFFMWKSAAADAEAKRNAPPPEYPDFAKGTLASQAPRFLRSQWCCVSELSKLA